MNDKVTTKSVGRDFAEINDFILDEASMYRLVFRAGIHSKGVNWIQSKKEGLRKLNSMTPGR